MHIKKVYTIFLTIFIICFASFFYYWINATSSITVHFVDKNGTLLKVKNITYYSKPYLLLNTKKLEKAVPGYQPVNKYIFFSRHSKQITVKFKSKNFSQEVKNFNSAKYVAATFQPMTVSSHNGFQSDPFNTARTYIGTETGKDSLRLIYSNNGIKWKKMNISYPKLNIRDPSIAKINGYWYIVYTKGLIRTKNFRHWEKIPWHHSSLFVNHFEWAPEFFKDKNGKYHIIMAGNSVTTHSFQLYVSDFNEKTGHIKNNWKVITGKNLPTNMIDGNLTYSHGKYILFYKNEDVTTNKLTIATSNNYLGPYKSTSLNVDLGSYVSAEGLEALFYKNKIRLYVDPYKTNKAGESIYNGIHYTEAKIGSNSWSKLKAITAPFITRHFGILKIN
ncbi:hypothetical protein LB941_09685 [Ligilactobacillus sp. WILCCON 0076]|uniref:Glycosyl hydrolase family 43 n=1 Tax=Ligilactobacillus ubinensis TaxID=2876789 RepID=A0A9X2FNV8_9LACO|nr:hypothetical protein [Ligilactobacillus ubinensis]MCP0887601.1 hypothetical protein [Ligilactobacillus ubinensis]